MKQYSKVEMTVLQLLAIMPTYGYDLRTTLGVNAETEMSRIAE